MGYWEITLFFMGFGVSICSIVATVEVILSFLNKPCYNWNENASKNCTLIDSPLCALMADNVYSMKDNGGKYYITSRMSPCITITTLHLFTVFILVIMVFFVIGGSGLTKLWSGGKSAYPRRFYASFLGVSMFLMLCWLAQLITVSGITSGYSKLCDVLSKPRCTRYPADIFTSIDCHFGTLPLPDCNQFLTESFVGRLKVALGMSWIGFLLMTFLIVVTILKLRTETAKQKMIAKKQEEQRIIQETVYPTQIPSVYLYPPSLPEEETYNENSTRYAFPQDQAPPIPAKRTTKHQPQYEHPSDYNPAYHDPYYGGYQNNYYDAYPEDYEENERSYPYSDNSRSAGVMDYGESTF